MPQTMIMTNTYDDSADLTPLPVPPPPGWGLDDDSWQLVAKSRYKKVLAKIKHQHIVVHDIANEGASASS